MAVPILAGGLQLPGGGGGGGMGSGFPGMGGGGLHVGPGHPFFDGEVRQQRSQQHRQHASQEPERPGAGQGQYFGRSAVLASAWLPWLDTREAHMPCNISTTGMNDLKT